MIIVMFDVLRLAKSTATSLGKEGVKYADYENIPFRTDKIILVTSEVNKEYLHGITNQQLRSITLYFSDLVEVSNSNWFYHIFPKNTTYPLSVDICTRLIPILKGNRGYNFLPYSAVETDLVEGTFIQIPLLETIIPHLHCYMV